MITIDSRGVGARAHCPWRAQIGAKSGWLTTIIRRCIRLQVSSETDEWQANERLRARAQSSRRLATPADWRSSAFGGEFCGVLWLRFVDAYCVFNAERWQLARKPRISSRGLPVQVRARSLSRALLSAPAGAQRDARARTKLQPVGRRSLIKGQLVDAGAGADADADIQMNAPLATGHYHAPLPGPWVAGLRGPPRAPVGYRWLLPLAGHLWPAVASHAHVARTIQRASSYHNHEHNHNNSNDSCCSCRARCSRRRICERKWPQCMCFASTDLRRTRCGCWRVVGAIRVRLHRKCVFSSGGYCAP